MGPQPQILHYCNVKISHKSSVSPLILIPWFCQHLTVILNSVLIDLPVWLIDYSLTSWPGWWAIFDLSNLVFEFCIQLCWLVFARIWMCGQSSAPMGSTSQMVCIYLYFTCEIVEILIVEFTCGILTIWFVQSHTRLYTERCRTFQKELISASLHSKDHRFCHSYV